MKVVVAPDSFKGNLTAVEVADWIEKGIHSADRSIEVKKIPVADGGEGTVQAMVTASGGNIVRTHVKGPLMEDTDSFFGILSDGKTAVIEMAAASGLAMVPEDRRNPMETTTYGVGQLIKRVLDSECSNIVIGIGGSATNDGGMGMAQALGACFYDDKGRKLGTGGKMTTMVKSIDVSGLDGRLEDVKITVACDVKNPLFGKNGASCVYGPQKGATPEMVEILDGGLRNLSSVVESDLGINVSDMPGSGAAGGLGAGLIAFAGAVLKPGIDIVLETSRAEEDIITSDLVITGEGKTDSQTVYGKVPAGIAALASKHNVPVVCLSGGLGDDYEEIYNCGIDAAFSNVTDAMTLDEAMRRSGELLAKTARSIIQLVLSFQ